MPDMFAGAEHNNAVLVAEGVRQQAHEAAHDRFRQVVAALHADRRARLKAAIASFDEVKSDATHAEYESRRLMVAALERGADDRALRDRLHEEIHAADLVFNRTAAIIPASRG